LEIDGSSSDHNQEDKTGVEIVEKEIIEKEKVKNHRRGKTDIVEE